MEKLLLIGGGGHCKSVLDTILESNNFEVVGIIDTKEKVGEKLYGVSYIGTDSDLEDLYNKGIRNAFISIGSIGSTIIRQNIYLKLKKIGFNLPNIIDSTAIVSRYSSLGNGIFVGKKAIINVGTIVEDNCIINTGAIVEHDCKIGKFVHLAPGTVLSGGVTVGNNTHIGTNATIIQYKSIGNDVIIGAGSVIVKDIYSNQKIYGNPGKEH